jgi:anti-sigma factor RsiW
MRTCDEMKTALVELVFGEPAPDVEMRLHQHLAACPSCRDQERQLLGLRDAVRNEEATPNAELRARIRAALPRRRAPGTIGLLSRPIPAYVAVAACLVGALAVSLLFRENWPGPGPVETEIRPTRVAFASQGLPFTPAGSYDTGVGPAAPAVSVRDSSAPERRQLRDTL